MNNNWTYTKLGNIIEESKIPSEKPDPNNRIRVRLNVGGVEKRPYTKEKAGATKYYKRKAGQFIYGKQNFHKGAFGIVPSELDGYESSSDIPSFNVDGSCLPEWLFYFFKHNEFYKDLTKLAKGAATQRVQPKALYELEIPLPSIEKQKNVIDKIKRVEKQHGSLTNEITKQRTYIQKLRQQILQDAIQGKLTEEWRRDRKSTRLNSSHYS